MSRDMVKDNNAGMIWPIQRIWQDAQQEVNTPVVLEEPLEIVVNGHSIATLMRMPGQEKELATGFCISEGYVRRVEDILLIHHCGLGHPAPGEVVSAGVPESRNRIELRVTEQGFTPSDRPDVMRLIRSGCGAADVSLLGTSLPHLDQNLAVSSAVLLGLGQAMRDGQTVHQQVGGTHGAALFEATGRFVTLSEDIGRHNAVDKVIGYCLLRGMPLDDKVLVTSGRASYEMAVKAIRVGLPIIATVSAPTALAVHLAQDRGLTLIGYLRGGRMNVYTHAGRVRIMSV